MRSDLRIDAARLAARLRTLGECGALPGGGVSRLALTDADKAGRDLVSTWMRDGGYECSVDAIGNLHAVRPGTEDLPPVLTGSHIDTVAAGGLYDGNLGVLAGLEVLQVLDDAGVRTRRPVGVSAFTGEEGARFAPDMLGSLVYVGGLGLDEALAVRDAGGAVLGEELERIGYAGDAPVGAPVVHAYVELHIEQGPVLEAEGVTIGAVQDLQGISWQEIVVNGQANHAGTTPMHLRKDAGYAAARIAAFLRDMTKRVGGRPLGTCGVIELEPDLINVIPRRARLTADLRNTDEGALREAEALLVDFLAQLAQEEGVEIEARRLARFEPVTFDADLAARVAHHARALGHSVRPMTSGAGHDAQMLARVCPAAMIFVPSRDGISHNPAEYTRPEDVEAGANVLLQTLLDLAE